MKGMLILMLAVMSASAMAEWVEAGKGEGFVVYYDDATIRSTSANKVKIWSLHDYQNARGHVEYRSVTLESEYDCIEKQSRRLFISFYQKNSGSGTTIRKNTEPGNWSPVRSGTIKESIWKIACQK